VQAEAQSALAGIPLPSCQLGSVTVNGGLATEPAALKQILDACRGRTTTFLSSLCTITEIYPAASFRLDATGRVIEVVVEMMPPPCRCDGGVCMTDPDAGAGDAAPLDGDADSGASDAGSSNDAGPTKDQIAACLTSAVRELSFPCNAGVKLCSYELGMAD
jgi:hypothetical protein